VYVFACVSVCLCKYLHVCLWVCMCLLVCVSVCVSVYLSCSDVCWTNINLRLNVSKCRVVECVSVCLYSELSRGLCVCVRVILDILRACVIVCIRVHMCFCVSVCLCVCFADACLRVSVCPNIESSSVCVCVFMCIFGVLMNVFVCMLGSCLMFLVMCIGVYTCTFGCLCICPADVCVHFLVCLNVESSSVCVCLMEKGGGVLDVLGHVYKYVFVHVWVSVCLTC